MNGDEIMDLLKDQLTELGIVGLVTRDMQDFAQRPATVAKAGVITIVELAIDGLKLETAFADQAGQLRIALLAEFTLPEKSATSDISRREWQIWYALREFIKAPGNNLCPLEAKRVQFSGQRDAPTGFLFVDLEYAELD